MKNNNKNRVISALLSLLIFLPTLLFAFSPLLSFAAEDTVYIESKEDFIEFSKNCSSDAYSQGRSFVLSADIDLTGSDFAPIPIFSGSFDGNGHTVSVILDGPFSPIGLFSHITKDSQVRNLNLHARVSPAGESDTVGGIAGINEGTIENCSFTGYIIGGLDVGGIAGINKGTGRIISSYSYGEILGSGRVGGIAGTNHGLIRDSQNEAKINTVCITPSMSLEEINLSLSVDLSKLPNINSLSTMDIGGICGFSGGFILGCSNIGAVGYPHVGYNLGGIAGRSTGHIASCENFGIIKGRRDVGGIVGQMEPYMSYKLSEDLLISLKTELDSLSSAVYDALKKETDGNEGITKKLDSLISLLNSATSSVESILSGGLDYADGLTEEVNRLMDVLSVVMSKFAQLTDDLPEISKHLTNGLLDIKDAMEKLGTAVSLGSDALSEMSLAMEDFSSAFDSITKSLGSLEKGLTYLKNSVKIKDYKAAETAMNTITEGLSAMVYGLDGLAEKGEMLISHFEKASWAEKILSEIKETTKIIKNISSAFDDLKGEAEALIPSIEEYFEGASQEGEDFISALDKIINSLKELDNYDLQGIKEAFNSIAAGLSLLKDSVEISDPDLVKDATSKIIDSLTKINEINFNLAMLLIKIGESLEDLTPDSQLIQSAKDTLIESGNALTELLPGLTDGLSTLFENLKIDSESAITGGMLIIDGSLGLADELLEIEDSSLIIHESLADLGDAIKELYEGINNQDNTKLKEAFEKLYSAFSDALLAVKPLPQVIYEIADTLYEAKIWGDDLFGYASDVAASLSDISDGLVTLFEGADALKSNLDLDFKGADDAISLLISGLGQLRAATKSFEAGLDRMAEAFSDLEGSTSYVENAFFDMVFAIIDVSKAANLITSSLEEADSLMKYLEGIDPISLPTPSDSIKNDLNKLFVTAASIRKTVDSLFDDVSRVTEDMAESLTKILDIYNHASEEVIDLIYGMENGDILYSEIGPEEINSLTNGRVFDCKNSAEIRGDINVGGISGSIGFEGSDPEGESDDQPSWAQKSHYRLKAVIDSSKNLGAVIAKRNNAGGILGNGDFGVIYNSEAYCSVESEAGDYVGGILGTGAVAVKSCYSKTSLFGGKYVGGIIGCGVNENLLAGDSLVEDCYSMVLIERGEQYLGAVAGRDFGDFKNNLFISDTLAGIDRVSYKGKTDRISYSELLKNRSVPEEFCKFTLSFIADGVVIREESFEYGASFGKDFFPAIPEKAGHYGVWDKTELSSLTFDTTVRVIYTPFTSAILSEEKRENKKQIFLAEGSFTEGDILRVERNIDLSGLEYKPGFFTRGYVGESFRIDLTANRSESSILHFLPENERAKIYIKLDGVWEEVEAESFGSYLIFSVDGDVAEIAVIHYDLRILPIAIIAGLLLFGICAGITISIVKKKRKKDPSAAELKAEG